MGSQAAQAQAESVCLRPNSNTGNHDFKIARTCTCTRGTRVPGNSVERLPPSPPRGPQAGRRPGALCPQCHSHSPGLIPG
eukprot:3019500-Rhodomonas_salina.2